MERAHASTVRKQRGTERDREKLELHVLFEKKNISSTMALPLKALQCSKNFTGPFQRNPKILYLGLKSLMLGIFFFTINSLSR